MKNDFKLGISVADGFRLAKELGLHKDASDSIPVEKPVFVNEDETIMVETGYGVSWDPVHRDRVLAALKKLGLELVHIKSCGCTDGLEVCEECDDHANEKAKPKSKPMFEQMADDIAVAVSAVVERYRPQIKKRKCSPHLVGDWIAEGFRRAKHLPKKKIEESVLYKMVHRTERVERDARSVFCYCGGLAPRVKCTKSEIRSEHNCGRSYECCCRAFKCRKCGTRIVLKAQSPEME